MRTSKGLTIGNLLLAAVAVALIAIVISACGGTAEPPEQGTEDERFSEFERVGYKMVTGTVFRFEDRELGVVCYVSANGLDCIKAED